MATDDPAGTDPRSCRVPCVRCLDRSLAIEEHLACPYCFGGAADVASMQRSRFCDFDAKRDPVVFGFPATHGRHRAA